MNLLFKFFEFACFHAMQKLTLKFIVVLLIFLTADKVNAQSLKFVADIAPLTASSDPQYLTSLNGKLYFRAFRDATGRELYAFDSITNEVSLVADLIPGIKGSDPKEIIVVDAKLYFLARTPFTSLGTPGAPDPFALFEYDPTSDSIRLLERFLSYSFGGYQISGAPSDLTEFNNKLYLFSAYADNVNETQNVLHVFDPATNTLVIEQYYGDRVPENLTILDNKMYFYTTDSYHARSLLMYDPVSHDSNVILEEFNIMPSSLVALDDKLYYAGHNGTYDNELYVINPSTYSFALAADINPDSSSTPQNFNSYNNKLYFQATGLQGAELFVYDPATGNARQVADINHGTGDSNPKSLFVFDNMLYFSANSGGLGRELFVYDSGSDTVSLIRIAPGAASSAPGSFAAFHDKLLFSANHPVYGRELWEISDDSAELQTPLAKLATFVRPISFNANWVAVPEADHYELDVFNVNDSTYLRGYERRVHYGTSLAVSGTDPSQRYAYVVRAVNQYKTSENSNAIRVAAIQALLLRTVCSDSPTVYRKWKVINNNFVPIEIKWQVNKTSKTATHLATVGESFF